MIPDDSRTSLEVRFFGLISILGMGRQQRHGYTDLPFAANELRVYQFLHVLRWPAAHRRSMFLRACCSFLRNIVRRGVYD